MPVFPKPNLLINTSSLLIPTKYKGKEYFF